MPIQHPLPVSNPELHMALPWESPSDIGSPRANIPQALSAGLRSMTRRTLSTEIAMYNLVNHEALSLVFTNPSSNGDRGGSLAKVAVGATRAAFVCDLGNYSRPLITLILVSGAEAVLTRQRHFLPLAELVQCSVY